MVDDKQWLEERFGRIMDNIDSLRELMQRQQFQIDQHEEYIKEIKKEQADCKSRVISQIEHILGKEEGMNVMYSKRRMAREWNLKVMTLVWGVLSFVMSLFAKLILDHFLPK